MQMISSLTACTMLSIKERGWAKALGKRFHLVVLGLQADVRLYPGRRQAGRASLAFQVDWAWAGQTEHGRL